MPGFPEWIICQWAYAKRWRWEAKCSSSPNVYDRRCFKTIFLPLTDHDQLNIYALQPSSCCPRPKLHAFKHGTYGDVQTKEMVRRNGRLTQSVGMQRNVYIMAYTFWQLSYSNRILPWLTEFGLLSWQAKQTALCQLCVSFSLPHWHKRAKFC